MLLRLLSLAAALAVLSPVAPAQALDGVDFTVKSEDSGLQDAVRQASGLLSGLDEAGQDAQSIHALALADYSRLIAALYGLGHYAPVISIRLDGREAAEIPALDAPSTINRVTVTVIPGPRFTFGKTAIAPLAPETTLPPGFAPGKTAESGIMVEASTRAVDAWRVIGHAKARINREELVADHARATLSADIGLDPGPRLRFGEISFQGHDRMRLDRLRTIAGFPEGKVFSPKELDRVARRLRRTGVFKSVSLAEAEGVRAPDLLDVTASLAENKPRQYSFSAELTSNVGLEGEARWMHRNLWGGAERLTIWARGSDLGSRYPDLILGARIERPATFTPDTTVSLSLEVGQILDIDTRARLARIEALATHSPSDELTLKAGLSHDYVSFTDPSGTFEYRAMSLPLSAELDRRDVKTDARKGYYLKADARPFFGYGFTGSGTRFALDARGYRALGTEGRFVLAGRFQLGAVVGSDVLSTPPDYLFSSGGGGTVRGQPYRSLGVDVTRLGSSDSFQLGGTHFLGASLETRYRLNDRVGVVGFVDFGRVDSGAFLADANAWHAGAGLGLRYATPIGPLRLDLAGPVGGATGQGLQVYLGLGQAF